MIKNNSSKFYNVIIVLILSLISILVFMVSNNLTDKKVDLVLKQKYITANKNLKDEVKQYIQNKKETTLSIALALVQNSDIVTALKINNNKLVKLKEFSELLNTTTKVKNAWFQIIDKNGMSFYRSWITKSGDSLVKARLDVRQMIKEPKIKTTISTGKFDMTFKSMVPIYDNNNFIGILEIITHFNSISKELRDNGTDSLIVVDKKYKKQLTKAIGKIFIDDYYIANLNYKPNLLEYVKEKGIEYYINNDNYIVDNKKDMFITKYTILDINGEDMGYVLMFRPLKLFNYKDIEYTKQNNTFYIILVVLFIFGIGAYIINRKHTKELDDKVEQRTEELNVEKNYIQTILDLSPNITVVSKNSKLISANKRFFDFFDYKDIEEFMKYNSCICDFFEIFDDNKFSEDKKIEGLLWSDYLVKYKDNEHLVSLKYKDKLSIFTISASSLNKNHEILLILQNITELKNKDKLLFEQSKMASMGDMIGNIAHQWRQPLSVISTASTGMKMQHEYNTLKSEDIPKMCDAINDNAQYLSKTIDDFRNFIKGDRTKKVFDLKQSIDSFLNLIEGAAKNNNINIILNLQEDIKINGYENELTQCFINIFNNAKDALKANIRNDEDRLIFISASISTNKDNVIITIKDNAGGIPEDIIDKVFEPYFTTKHKSQGTGLGLHMTYNLIVDGMSGTIEATNVNYSYEDKDYVGAQFIISLPNHLD